MDKVEMIKSLYEELTCEEKSRVYYELLNKDNKASEEIKPVDFYSDEFIDFITHSNYFRKQLYLLDCEEIEQINYIDNKGEKHIFNTYDEAEEYFEKYFDNVMKINYTEDSDEYLCFNILSAFDFDDVEEKCKQLGYTIGLEKEPITKEGLIKNSVELLQELCSREDITFNQIGRLHAFKVLYPREDGGNYFSLMYCIEQYDNAL